MYSPITILLYIFLLLTTAAAVKKKPTVPEWVKEHILQDVMLSTNIKSYTLNKDTGEFEVKLHAMVDIAASDSSYHLMCKSTIRGVINKDMSSVTKLEGVSAKVGASWADIEEITRIDGDTDADSDSFHFRFCIRDVDTSNFSDSSSSRGYVLTKVQRGWGFVKEKIKLLKWSL